MIRKAGRKDASALLTLIEALARFEKLEPPSRAARQRLIDDGFGPRHRYDAFLAEVHGKPVGYAIVFETYSSFLARPTLYLEDIFVLPGHRRHRIGLKLLLWCVREAQKRGCGRMEWMVLDWNVNAIRFYERLGTRELKGWIPFRVKREEFSKLLKILPHRQGDP